MQARLYSMHGQALPRSFSLGAEAAKERITDAAIYGDGLVALTGGAVLTFCWLDPYQLLMGTPLCLTHRLLGDDQTGKPLNPKKTLKSSDQPWSIRASAVGGWQSGKATPLRLALDSAHADGRHVLRTRCAPAVGGDQPGGAAAAATGA